MGTWLAAGSLPQDRRCVCADLENRVGHHHERTGALFAHRHKDAIELTGVSRLHDLKLHTQDARRGLGLAQQGADGWIGGIRKDGHPGDLRDDVLDQLQAFPAELRVHVAQSRNVPPGVREVGDETTVYRIADEGHDDGGRLGCLLSCLSRRR